MGYRLHYATEYKINYDGGYFNHKNKGINHLLVNFCHADFSGTDVENAEHLEVERSNLLWIIDRWKENPQELEFILNQNGYDYSIDEMLEILQEIADKSDQSNSFIKLVWW